MSPDWRRKGGQVQLPKMSTTGFLSLKLDSRVSFFPEGSARVKSGAASPSFSLSGCRSPGAGGVNFSPGNVLGESSARPVTAQARTAPANRQAPAFWNCWKRMESLLGKIAAGKGDDAVL